MSGKCQTVSVGITKQTDNFAPPSYMGARATSPATAIVINAGGGAQVPNDAGGAPALPMKCNRKQNEKKTYSSFCRMEHSLSADYH